MPKSADLTLSTNAFTTKRRLQSIRRKRRTLRTPGETIAIIHVRRCLPLFPIGACTRSPAQKASLAVNSPSVSVVLPVHNGQSHLAQAVDSVLAQSFADFELLICDDGSNDGTFELATAAARRDPRVRVLRREAKSGVADAANWAAHAATAPLVAMMHADDICLADRLERQVRVFSQHADCVLNGGPAEAINWHGEPAHTPNLWPLVRPSAFAPMAHSSIMFRRGEFEAVGGYRTQAGYWEDLDLFWRLATRGRILVSINPLTIYRYSRTSIRQRDDAHMVERALETMYRRAETVAIGRIEPEDTLRAGRFHPRIFVARSWSRLWAGERTEVLPHLLRRGRLRLDRATLESLGFVTWASISPRSLRAVLRLIARLRNRIALRELRGAETVEWQPHAASNGSKTREEPVAWQTA